MRVPSSSSQGRIDFAIDKAATAALAGGRRPASMGVCTAAIPAAAIRGIRRLLAVVAIMLGALALSPMPVVAHAPQSSSSLIGAAAPQFALPDIHGRERALSNYKGRVVVLNFWAFWCDTWRAEMPSLRQLGHMQSDLDFALVAVSVDGTRLSEFSRRTSGEPSSFPVLLDSDGAVSRRYRIAHVPTVVIIDRAGVIRYTAYGYPGNHAVLDEIRKLVSLPAARR